MFEELRTELLFFASCLVKACHVPPIALLVHPFFYECLRCHNTWVSCQSFGNLVERALGIPMHTYTITHHAVFLVVIAQRTNTQCSWQVPIALVEAKIPNSVPRSYQPAFLRYMGTAALTGRQTSGGYGCGSGGDGSPPLLLGLQKKKKKLVTL